MSLTIRVPKLGEGADSGTVVNILVKEGDKVAKDQTLIELENEKAVAPIPSTTSGVVSKIHVKLNDKISVGAAIVTVEETGAPAAKTENVKAAETSAAPSVSTAKIVQSADGYRYESKSGVPPPASPTIRKMAQELGIDLTRVKGSEAGGRIVLQDLKDYISRLQDGTAQSKGVSTPTQDAPKAHTESIDFSKWGPVKKEAFTALRQAISRKMVESWTTIPHVTQYDDADITDLLALRKKYVDTYTQKGASLTLTGFVLKALAKTLLKHPKLNASIDEAAQTVVFKSYVHVGIAVDTEQGLIVPVLRDVDKKNLLQVSKELQELAEKTRARKIALDDLKGGSFTISNQGGIGGGYFTPIINKPEVAILGLGKGAAKPVVRNKVVETRTILPVSLSYDHRLIDGAEAVRFLNDLIDAIVNFKEEDAKI